MKGSSRPSNQTQCLPGSGLFFFGGNPQQLETYLDASQSSGKRATQLKPIQCSDIWGVAVKTALVIAVARKECCPRSGQQFLL